MKKKAFTIIELLTVMSIMIFLIGIVTSSMAAVRRYTKKVQQKNQFHNISNCLESYYVEFGDYPESLATDILGQGYCGAMKLCEALVGQDGFGFHTRSKYIATDPDGLYYNRKNVVPDPINNDEDRENLQGRIPPCLSKVQISGIGNLFSNNETFDPYCPVICDVFKRNDLRVGDKKAGMPVLYFKADTTGYTHDANGGTIAGTNIYNYMDNYELLRINPPWASLQNHPLFEESGESLLFYNMTTNDDMSIEIGGNTFAVPHNKDAYILWSAGLDGWYGTEDDIVNF